MAATRPQRGLVVDPRERPVVIREVEDVAEVVVRRPAPRPDDEAAIPELPRLGRGASPSLRELRGGDLRLDVGLAHLIILLAVAHADVRFLKS
jgi:hypothetical protein